MGNYLLKLPTRTNMMSLKVLDTKISDNLRQSDSSEVIFEVEVEEICDFS